MHRAALVLLLSACLQLLCFLRWPGNPDWDVHHSIFAAQNFLAHRGLKSIDLFPEPTDDLSQLARIHWMTHWPPIHSLLYVAVMEFGLEPGPATKVLVLLCILVGGLGWLFVAKRLNASSTVLYSIALAYPWLAMIARSQLDYKNDHMGCALAPWIYFVAIGIEPLAVAPREQWRKLIGAALLAGSVIWVKYSLAPLLIGSALYVLWLDRFTWSRERILRLVTFGVFAALPGLLLWAVNHAWGGTKYPITGGGIRVSKFVFAKNLIANSVGAASGWEFLVIQANAFAEKFGRHVFPGVVFLVSLLVSGLWALQLLRTRWQDQEKRFLACLLFVSFAFMAMLIFTTWSSPIRYDFTSDGRFALPASIGWVFAVGMALGTWQHSSKLRSGVAVTLIVPILFSVGFYAGTGLFATPYAELPRTEAACLFGGPKDAAFLGTLEHSVIHPDLLVVPRGEFLSELETPVLYTDRVMKDKRDYESSRDLKVLAIVSRDQSWILDKDFSRASVRKSIIVPENFPYSVWELHYQASPVLTAR
jgi:hypothetical protein